MKPETRYLCARISYWMLFVIAPAAVCVFVFDVRPGTGLLIAFLLLVAGEYGFRPWKRLWRMND
jgi:hypothetical protein